MPVHTGALTALLPRSKTRGAVWSILLRAVSLWIPAGRLQLAQGGRASLGLLASGACDDLLGMLSRRAALRRSVRDSESLIVVAPARTTAAQLEGSIER